MDNHDEIIVQMQADIREIRNDVKRLIEFRGKVFGGVMVLSTMISILVTLGSTYLK